MTNNVTRFVSRAERIARDRADEARQAVLDLGLPETAEVDILATIQRHETGGYAGWRFNMINAQQCLAVWNAIRDTRTPHETRAVFDYALTHVETNTGIVVLTREEIAEKVNIRPQEVSSSMGQLEKIGAIIRERIKVPGMKGPGKARYRINPHVAWNGTLDRRAVQAEREQPVQSALPLEVIEGGAA